MTMKRLLLFLALFVIFSAAAHAQVTALMPWQPEQFSTSAGVACAGCKVCTYAAGTSTGLATYTDQTGVTLNNVPPNAIVLDSTGKPPSGIWLTIGRAYKIILMTAGTDATCSTGTTLITRDQINAWPRYTCTAAPVSGTYQTGDICFNSTPSSASGSASAYLGWICTSGGTPGTWVPIPGGLNNHFQNSITVDQNLTVTGTLTAPNFTFNGDPGDPTQYLFKEDFEVSAGGVRGIYGWGSTTVGNGCTTDGVAAGSFAHPGVLTIVTAAVAAGDGCLTTAESNTGLVGPIGNNNNWTIYLIFQLAQTSNTTFRMGFSDTAGTSVANGTFLRYVSTSDTNFTFENIAASTSTISTTNSVAADTNYHCVKMVGTSTPGTVGFQIGSSCSTLGVQTLVAGASTSANVFPYIELISNTAAGAKTANIDLFYYNATGIR